MKATVRFGLVGIILFLSVNLFAQDEAFQNGLIDGKTAFTNKVSDNIQKSDSISYITVIFQYTNWGKKNYLKLGLPKKSIDGKLIVIRVNANANKYQLLAYKYIYVSRKGIIEEDFKCYMSPWRSVEPNTPAAKWVELCSTEAIAKTVN